MRLAQRAPATPPATLDAALAKVRSHGLRASSARRVLLTALMAAERPITAEAIARGLDGRVPRSDVASIYRNLDTLEQIGLVHHVNSGHGAALYMLAREDGAGYAFCSRCGELRAAGSEAMAAVRAAVRAAVGWDASFADVPIVGICPDCAGEER